MPTAGLSGMHFIAQGLPNPRMNGAIYTANSPGAITPMHMHPGHLNERFSYPIPPQGQMYYNPTLSHQIPEPVEQSNRRPTDPLLSLVSSSLGTAHNNISSGTNVMSPLGITVPPSQQFDSVSNNVFNFDSLTDKNLSPQDSPPAANNQPSKMAPKAFFSHESVSDRLQVGSTDHTDDDSYDSDSSNATDVTDDFILTFLGFENPLSDLLRGKERLPPPRDEPQSPGQPSSTSVSNEADESGQIHTPDRSIPPPSPQIYKTSDEMIESCHSHGKTYGYQVSIIRSGTKGSKWINTKAPGSLSGTETSTQSTTCTDPRTFIQFRCVSKWRKQSIQATDVETEDKREDCQFTLYASRVKEGWSLRITHDTHNHLQDFEKKKGTRASRVPMELRESVWRMFDTDLAPERIKDAIRVDSKGKYSVPIRSIYAEKQKYDQAKYGSKSRMSSAIHYLGESNFHVKCVRDKENKLERLFFANKKSMELANRFNSVILIDCTYNTNRHKMPLLSIVGVSNLWRTFHIALAFVPRETQSDFVWALNCLTELYTEDTMPKVIVTDRDLALGNAIDEVFGSTVDHLLCRWHINKDVTAKISKLVRKKEPRVKILQGWKRVIEARDEEEQEVQEEALIKYLADCNGVKNYFNKAWMPYSEKFLHSHTNETMHFTTQSSSRVEGSHAGLKRRIANAHGDLFRVIRSVVPKILTQLESYYDDLEYERRVALQKYVKVPLFATILKLVSRKALSFLHKEMELCKEDNLDECRDIFTKTMGLPCRHRIKKKLDKGEVLELDDIHSHWHLYHGPLPETIEPDYDECITKAKEVYESLEGEAKREFSKDLLDYIKNYFLLKPPDTVQRPRGRPRGSIQVEKS